MSNVSARWYANELRAAVGRPSDMLASLRRWCRPAAAELKLCRPGLRYGPLPTRKHRTRNHSALDLLLQRGISRLALRRFKGKSSMRWLRDLDQRVEELLLLESSDCVRDREKLVEKLKRCDNLNSVPVDVLAHACLAVRKKLGLTPRANQLIAVQALITGHCVEMATGEGKTLSIALAAATAALSGTPVHVLTANDYLAERDSHYLQNFYQSLGLSVACVSPGLAELARREVYQADIVYVTGKQVAFDWLNDVLMSGATADSLVGRLGALTAPEKKEYYTPVVRGLCLAIVDEADSLLIDEACIPLVLAAGQSNQAGIDTEAVVALGLAGQLKGGSHYIVVPGTRQVKFTEDGRAELARLAQRVSRVWRSTRFREERVNQALVAMFCFRRDMDYMVRDGKLELIDAHTGRPLADRRLQFGLHRMLEVKENCQATQEHETLASIPFQHFFNRYRALVGISGTLKEVSNEVHRLYGLDVVCVSPHQPCKRKDLPHKVYLRRVQQLLAMIDDVKKRNDNGQPVLVCTRSVEQSMGASAMLQAHGITHRVLNAYQNAEEAEIVAAAGLKGSVTVATNMAGRGTDIPLGPGVVDLGGLHVMSLAFNDARRLDRQLAGRAARQGDPGSFQQLICLDDFFLVQAIPDSWAGLASASCHQGWHIAAGCIVELTKRKVEWKFRRQRVSMYKSRDNLESVLAFGGQQGYL